MHRLTGGENKQDSSCLLLRHASWPELQVALYHWLSSLKNSVFVSGNRLKYPFLDIGAVKLLTKPVTAGYIQNPISVYYCYSREGALTQCIAEVTNTPWAAKVIFLFNPEGQSVPKALHVSPFMDMQNTW